MSGPKVVVWLMEREGDPTFPRLLVQKSEAEAWVKFCNVGQPVTFRPVYVMDSTGDPARSALVEALKTARDYVEHGLSREREIFDGHENCSDIPAIERDLAQIDAALLAAGEGL